MALCRICGASTPPFKYKDKRQPSERLTCSRICQNKYVSRISASNPERRRKISVGKLAEKNPNWVGDRIKKGPLHAWVIRRFPKPESCKHCKEAPPYDLANKGEYTRDLSQWEWLCRRCHMLSDGRLERLRTRSLSSK